MERTALRPSSTAPGQIHFEPMPMVDWLSPRQLVATAMKVALSGTFAAYSDKREIEAQLDDEVFRYVDDDVLCIDFVADTGDGFNPAYTIAHLLAATKLDVGGANGHGDVALERGHILVMGGDQVYPCATIDEYENRLIGPYRAALPFTSGNHPHLYAIPGNHDWYDGLTAFMRVFCQQGWVGGRMTRQHRSYFALQLPHRWWLMGIDIQFESYIDSGQRRYFEKVAAELRPGDSVILCTAKPSWVEEARGHADAFRYLDFFERTFIRGRSAHVRLCLTGDSHHYARYEGGGIQRITAGGGGAYLSATHHLPESVTVPSENSRDPGRSEPVTYVRRAAYPTAATSRRKRRDIFGHVWRSRSFCALVAGVYALYGWTAESALSAEQGLAEVLEMTGWADLLTALFRSPTVFAFTAVLLLGLAGFTKQRRKLLALGHLAAHLGVILPGFMGVAALAQPLPEPFTTAVFTGGLLVLGGVGGTQVFALYLAVADRFACNTNELFAAQRIEDHKNFLRLKLDEDGTLTVYPVGVDRVCRSWEFRPEGSLEEAWFAPATEITPHLIEAPIVIQPRPGPTHPEEAP